LNFGFQQLDFNSWNFLPGISNFGAKNHFFSRKKAYTLRITKDGVGWLVGWAYGILFCMDVMVKK